MNRSLLTTLAGAALVSCLAAAPAHAGITIQIRPPAVFIATSRPVYYQGHATYWYGNRWRYRHGQRWQYYNAEPRYLRDYRNRHHEPERHYYGNRR
jgi:hypothetical protein